MSVPANVAAARQQVITTDYYALGHLALCIASYSDDGGEVIDIQKAIAANVPTIGQIGDVPGTWTLDWGPAITTNLLEWKANLLFAASYRDPSTNDPIFSAIVIRGTDVSAGFLGVLEQLREDVKPGCQLMWPSGEGRCASRDESSSSTPYMAKGSFDGLNNLITIKAADGTTLQDFLPGFLTTYADDTAPLPLVVTGHSLGGCLTAPLALWVNTQVANAMLQSGVTVVPNSFAAPTAGNQAFADAYLAALPNARRWFNTFDLVPMAYDALDNIENLWSVSPYLCGNTFPALAKPIVSAIKIDVGHLQYAHEGGNANRQLNGVCDLNANAATDSDWGTQFEYQHFPPCGYWSLMLQSQYASTFGSLSYPQWVNNPLPVCST